MKVATFEHNVRRLRAQLLQRALTLLHDKSKAEDAVQDTLLRLWEVHDKVDSTDAVQRLAFSLLRYRCLDQLHPSPPTQPLDSIANDSTAARETTDEPLETADNDLWLSQRVEKLPEAVRRMWKMKQKDQLTTIQIAQILGISARTVQNAIAQARRQLTLEYIHRNQKQQ